ncbi:MAG TPA: PepSY-associated TM helix domain-containing protein [Pyrinomonadaceae bacterium]|nr:PepSY-associated TM helix domain-containing protein [Pyrinomonadaceae bacterium]
MKRFRKVIFWCHLAAGSLAAVVILVMSVTGVLLTYERQLTAWADARGLRAVERVPGAARLPVETLVANAREGRPAQPTALTVRADADAPVMVSFGREGVVFVNPYTGEVLGEGARGVRSFFRTITDWHRWLGAQGENRNVARAVTGASNLAFLFLVTSGFYLWFPRSWTRKQFRSISWFRRGLAGKARDFNWHNVVGVWSAVPLFIVVLSAVPISYTWAGNLVYRIVGETPPAPRPAPTQTGGATPSGGSERRAAEVSLGGLDSLLARAERQVEGWRSVSMQLPTQADAPVTFTIDRGDGGQPQKRAQLTLERASGEVARWEPFASYTAGRRLRSYMRFAHTGEVLGLFGQTIAGLVSLGGAVLVYTGLALAFRRLRAWAAGRVRESKRETRDDTEILSASGAD